MARRGSGVRNKKSQTTIARVRLRRDDQVVVIAGKERGKTGRILRIDVERQRVVVEGLNLVKKTMRPTQQRKQGGISEIEAPIHLSNVMLTSAEGRSRIRYAVGADSKRRIIARTGQEL